MKPLQGTSVVEQETTESVLKCRNKKLTSTWVARMDSIFDSKSYLSWKESLKTKNHDQSSPKPPELLQMKMIRGCLIMALFTLLSIGFSYIPSFAGTSINYSETDANLL